MNPNGTTAPPAAPASQTGPANAANPANLTSLVSGILTDAQTLLRQQVDMFRAEVKEDMRRTARVAQYMGAGAAVATLGGLFLAVSLVHLLAHYAPHLPHWSHWAIVGGAFVAAGGAAVFAGQRLLSKFNPLPDKTFNAAQENVSWIANPQT